MWWVLLTFWHFTNHHLMKCCLPKRPISNSIGDKVLYNDSDPICKQKLQYLQPNTMHDSVQFARRQTFDIRESIESRSCRCSCRLLPSENKNNRGKQWSSEDRNKTTTKIRNVSLMDDLVKVLMGRKDPQTCPVPSECNLVDICPSVQIWWY